MAGKEPQQPQQPQPKPKPPAPPPKKRNDDEDEPERRGFLVKAGAVVVGGVVLGVPVASGMYTLSDPLTRKEPASGAGAPQAGDGKFIPVAYLNEIPTDGMPRRFPVQKHVRDAWNFFENEPVGAVYLRLVPGQPLPTAVTATCPHLGCSVVFEAKEKRFQCPCHDSKFEPDGKRIDPERCPSARDLDSLNVEVRPDDKGNNVVYVEFQKFKGGSEKKIVKE